MKSDSLQKENLNIYWLCRSTLQDTCTCSIYSCQHYYDWYKILMYDNLNNSYPGIFNFFYFIKI